MPSIKPDQLETSLRSGKIGKLYLFDGPENLLKERAVSRIIDKLLPKEARDFNLDRLDATSASGGAVVTSAQSLPFLSDRRVIVVHSADEFSAADGRLVGESLAQLPESTCLIFISEGKANLREEIPAHVESHGQVVTFWTPFKNQIPAWIMNEVRQRGKSIAPEAAAALADACSNLQDIAHEIDKLCLFVGKNAAITYSDLKRHGLPDEEGDFKELEEALWRRDVAAALEQGQLLSEIGVRAESIFPVFERVFRTLLLGHLHLNRDKKGLEELYTELRIRGKTQQTRFATAMRAYRGPELQESIGKIAQADYELKTGTLPGPIAVTFLTTGILGLPQSRQAGREAGNLA